MNRIVLIGNGFDLAHGLKTRYNDFIAWYWEHVREAFKRDGSREFNDDLCQLKRLDSSYESCRVMQKWHTANGIDIYNVLKGSDSHEFFDRELKPFFEHICDMAVENWVDIENEYYHYLLYGVKNPRRPERSAKELNDQMDAIKGYLAMYLKICLQENSYSSIPGIMNLIYSPIKEDEISVLNRKNFREDIANQILDEDTKRRLQSRLKKYQYKDIDADYLKDFLSKATIERDKDTPYIKMPDDWNKKDYPSTLYLPDHVLLLSFNYTDTVNLYQRKDISETIKIHGSIDDPESMIFGFGDELDDSYQILEKQENTAYMDNVKSIRYSEAGNYRKLLRFIESEPYQVLILGHSCGNSDRTLLSTIFEHENCISIKPFYYKPKQGADGFRALSQNICRNFRDKKAFRDKLVDKTLCEPHPQCPDKI